MLVEVRQDPPGGARRTDVLESALRTFARHGYRRTSMADVAEEARISRPGLYLYFPSKEAVLRAAVEQALAKDVARAEVLLADGQEPLRGRLLEAFDLWAGQYTGPFAVDLEGLLEQDAALLADLPAVYRDRFRAAVERAVSEAASSSGAGSSSGRVDAHRVAEVLLAFAAGVKRRAVDRDGFRERFRWGLDLFLG